MVLIRCEHLALVNEANVSRILSVVVANAMDEQTINAQLRKNPNYLGSFAVDELDEIKVSFFPCFTVINLDRRNAGGSHWIALAFYQNEVYICDSLGGLVPNSETPQALAEYIYPILCKRKIFITKRMQDLNSDTCALYCIEFIRQMSLHNSICEFIRLFTNDYAKNDQLIKFLNKKDL